MTSAWRAHLGLIFRIMLIATLTLSGVVKLLGWEAPLLLFVRAGLGVSAAKGFGVAQVLAAALLAWDRAARPGAILAFLLFGAGVAVLIAAGALADLPLAVALTLVALFSVVEPAVQRPARSGSTASDPRQGLEGQRGEQVVDMRDAEIPLRHERRGSSEV
jgi:membrane protein implicated in regulation of membrane protease activity